MGIESLFKSIFKCSDWSNFNLYNVIGLSIFYSRYRSGQQAEADESTALIFLGKSRIESWDIPDSLAMRLTQHALGGLRLYHLFTKLQGDS